MRAAEFFVVLWRMHEQPREIEATTNTLILFDFLPIRQPLYCAESHMVGFWRLSCFQAVSRFRPQE